MGNEQSVPAPRRPNKLSKPRTNNNSTSNLLNIKTSAPATRQNSLSTNASPTKIRYSFVPTEVAGEAGEKPKDEATTKRRMSLFKSRSAQEKPSLHLNTELGSKSVEPSPLEQPNPRWSRQPIIRSSTIFELGAADGAYFESPIEITRPPLRNPARTSLKHVPYSHPVRLSVVGELPSPQSTVSEVSRRQSVRLEDNTIGTALATRTNSDTTLYGPIRRRSLLQHGVATRTSYVEPDARQSLPSQTQVSDEIHNHYYNPSKPTSSPLSDLAAWSPNPDFATHERTSTPTELDYGHIGAFKLGTLRITNGASSPSPSSHRRASFGAEEDYITAGEARNVESSHQHGLIQRSNTISNPADTGKASWIVHAESPLNQEVRYEPLTIDTQLPFDPSFALFHFEESKSLSKGTESVTKAEELANEYMQNIALSPFSFENSPPMSPILQAPDQQMAAEFDSPPRSPAFQATSKHMAIEDDLFEPEPDTPTDPGTHMPRSFDSGYIGGEPSSASTSRNRDLAPKPLAKADSGYSSNVSLRSFKKDHPVKEAPATPPKDLTPVSPVASLNYESISRVPSSAYSVASTTTLRTKASLPALPTDDIPEQPLRQPPPVPAKEQFYQASPRMRPPPVPVPVLQTKAEAYSPPQSFEAAKPNPTQPQQQPSMLNAPRSKREASPANSDVSNGSTNSASRWRPKLTKRESQQRAHAQSLSQNETPFTVQAFRSSTEAFRIPPPSAEIRDRLEKRVEDFPVQNFPNTLANPSLRRFSSKETLRTIFSVGSAEVRDELSFARLQEDLPPVPPMPTIPQSAVPQRKPVSIDRRNTYQTPPPPAQYPLQQPRQGRQSFQPVSRERAPSPNQRANWGRQNDITWFQPQPPMRRQSQHEFETSITSVESISNSLGRGAYDVAKPLSKVEINERARSMTAQFEADAAARFSLSRQTQSQSQHRDFSGESTQSVESKASTVIRPRKSYDSIANGNPFASGSPSSSRVSSREFKPPPAAHSNTSRRSYTNLNMPLPVLSAPPSSVFGPGHIATSYKDFASAPSEAELEQQRCSLFEKERRSPPVSMTTQRKSIPKSKTPPPPLASPTRLPPGPPPQQQPRRGSVTAPAPVQESGRRKSEGEGLTQARHPIETRRRPSFAYGVPQDHDARLRQIQGVDQMPTAPQSQTRRPLANQSGFQGMSPTARKSHENMSGAWSSMNPNARRSQENLNLRGRQGQPSFEESQQIRRPSSTNPQQRQKSQENLARARKSLEMRSPSSVQSPQYQARQSQESLRTRQSLEMRRPARVQTNPSYSSFNPQALAARQSQENMQRPGSMQPGSNQFSSSGNSPQAQAQAQPGRWDVYSNIFGGPGAQGQAPSRPQPQTPMIMLQPEQEYSHAFGARDTRPVQEDEYYESSERQRERVRPEQMRRESTSEMLTLGGRYEGYLPGVRVQG